jgi:hypothetical protein
MADDPDLVPETEYAPYLPAPIAGTIAPSPYSFEFTGEDRLRLTVHNSLAGVRVSVHYRVHREGATTHASAEVHAPTSNRLASSREFLLGAGYLLNVTCFASAGSPRVGQTFVKLEVIRGEGAAAYVLGTILQDYVTANQPIAWPGSPLRSSIEGGGVIRMINGTTPAVGVEFLEVCPTGARWQVLSIFSIFNSSATVVQRRVVLFVTNSGLTAGVYAQEGTIGANDGKVMMWAPGLPAAAVASGYDQMCPIASELMLLAGDNFSSLCNNFQPGDWYTAPKYLVREWLEAQ